MAGRPSKLMAAALVASAALGSAQDAPETTPESLRVEIEITRGAAALEAGGARPARHVLHVTADRPPATSLRVGREVPIREQYRNVGTNIQCRVKRHGTRYLVWLQLEESHLVTAGALPTFDTFSIAQEVVLSPGEATEIVSASGTGASDGVQVRIRLLEAP